MQKIKLEYLYDGAAAGIMLDDGKGNVLDSIMMAELQQVFNEFRNKPSLKVFTLEGAGKHFSFGASVEEHQKEFAAEMLRNFHQLFYSVLDLSIPAIAKISGQCLGGGFELAMVCNLMFADKTAKMGQPEIQLGVFPPPASIILQEKIGEARAAELLISGRTISAEAAQSLGLVSQIFENREELDKGTLEWIEKHILPKSASSLRYAVSASRMKFNHIVGKFLPMLEQLYMNKLMNTRDANEGIAAFLEKRAAKWD